MVLTSRQLECPNTLSPAKRIRYQYTNIQSNPAGYATNTGLAGPATSATHVLSAAIASLGSAPSSFNLSRSRPLTATASGMWLSEMGLSSR